LPFGVLLKEFVARLKGSLCIAVIEGICKLQIKTVIDGRYAIGGK
jgi:hypothetical protein